jgi:hypothetical protein
MKYSRSKKMESIAMKVENFIENEQAEKVHPWRLCPLGKHYVKEHQERIPPSKKHPEGEIITRHAHCASNPLGKHYKEIRDVLLFDELQIIATTHFSGLQGPPKANVLHYRRADEFDSLIRGWTLYWNEIFKEDKDPLDPNLVKSLIASESGFDPDIINPKNPPKIGPARGLMQLTDFTLRILHGHEVELRDHFVYLSHATVMDPSANICAGARWLFQKRAVAKERYAKVDPNHIVTWVDAVAEYKGVLSGILDKDNQHPDPENKMPTFRSIYEKFQE